MQIPRAEEFPPAAIVTPVYNGEVYLSETMEAVQAQDYPNLVHIVLDNASTDGTPEILARYANAKVPVRVFRNAETLPLARNWNAAVDHIPADVKYFRILCADDLIAPAFMTRAIELGERHASVGVIGTYLHENDDPTIDTGWPKDREVIPGPEAMDGYFRRRWWLPSVHAVFRRTDIHRGTPFFDENLVANDLAATLRILTRSDLGIVHADLAMTRLHGNSITSRVLVREKRHFYEWLKLLEQFAPVAMGDEKARAYLTLYRRRYLRQLVKWGIEGDRDLVALHLKGLRALNVAPTAAQFADAALDSILMKIQARERWKGYPFLKES